ncbi:hypothetical protein BBF96_02390 [Anoxybacter fermentans]|uniref:Radical SAM core domain-containing protein n=1 Tax=Anoxybacter fermentans TaxID=1323375 RepID=A0A3Q9HP17_9FIRM|nr:radical SAM protein [Anoxybacter fermentans]AZR72339.1 hypothetical protein BBF96_02390 [Anoxybacter fermentans]
MKENFEKEWLENNCPQTKVTFDTMYLVTTMDCNLACKYCVVLGNENYSTKRINTMEIETGIAALNLFKKQLAKTQPENCRITFYGGEPLLNQKLLFALIPKIREITYPNMSNPIEIVIITNGYLYNPELTELCKKHNVDIAISIDGKREHHDMTRVTSKTLQGTFDQVIKNLKKYQESGLNIGITTTIGQHNYKSLPEIGEYFVKELGIKFIEFQLPCLVPNDNNPYWVSTEEFVQKLMETYDLLQSYDAIEGTTYRRIKDFARGKIRFTDCGAAGSQLVIAPDGMMGPCHSFVGSRTFFEGNVKDKNCDPSEMDNFIEWAKRIPLNMEICIDCPFISLCGGGCIYNSYIASGTIWNKDPQMCSYIKGMVDWILKDLWKKTGMSEKYGIS